MNKLYKLVTSDMQPPKSIEVYAQYPDAPMYYISLSGKVYSKYSNRLLSQAYDKDGYKKLQLFVDGKPIYRRVHKMVAETFIPNTKNYDMINHINAIKDDNRMCNLEWCDNSYNQKYRYDVMGEKWNRESFKDTFTKIKCTNTITGEVLEFESITDCSKYFNCSDSAICNRLSNRCNNPSNSPKSRLNGIYFERQV